MSRNVRMITALAHVVEAHRMLERAREYLAYELHEEAASREVQDTVRLAPLFLESSRIADAVVRGFRQQLGDYASRVTSGAVAADRNEMGQWVVCAKIDDRPKGRIAANDDALAALRGYIEQEAAFGRSYPELEAALETLERVR